MDAKKNLKILLLQIRDNRNVRVEEHQSFANFSKIEPHQIEILNVFDTPSFKPNLIDNYDALYVGGASEANVLEPEKYPFIKNCIELLRYAAEISKPTFASCFGFQLAVLAFGGIILNKDKDYEMGTVKISLTDKAKSDLVYQGIQDRFPAVSVHRQYASTIPEPLEILAYTGQCVHSFKYKNKPLWAFQFHPEVDRDTLVKRLTIFSQHYTDDREHLKKVLESAVETPESNILLGNFVDRVLL
jgi:GMP synthase (glutamine-hydrolysing)